MEYKKPLIGAVSAITLAATLPAMASVSAGYHEAGSRAESRPLALSSNADLVMDFLLVSNGDLSPASVVQSLHSLFPNVSDDQAGQFPALLDGLRSIGLSDESRRAMSEAMLQLISDSEQISDDVLFRVGTDVLARASAKDLRVSQLLTLEDGICVDGDPTDPDCPPETTESIGDDGGNGGGGYSG
jgi:hypothetical protein